MFEKNQKAEKNDNMNILRATDQPFTDGLNSAAHHAGTSVRSMLNSASEELSYAGNRVKSEIRSNPVRSTAIALGVGALIGLLIRR
jgi:ElaB/YqjD/DUF883 family membrane-anchored ribosome-binding protein